MLKKIWKAWKKFGKFIGTVIGTIISTVLYIAVVTPFGILVRLSTDYFRMDKKHKTMWVERGPKDLTLKEMRKQH
ncbi:MAG: hypothetical protein KKH98_05660 [Spirochaetes bacterium]|nr:hypothetical protein [Spirochaetota bacterium]